LFITVNEPKSHVTTIETFIIYRIITKTSHGEFDSSEFEVRRHYQAQPTLIIPPLPEKFIVKGMVECFNGDVTEIARKALHKFLNRVADHPTLTFNEDFKVFPIAQITQQDGADRAAALSMRGVKSHPEESMEMNNFVEIFKRDYFDEMKEYDPIPILWSASEGDLADTLKGVASCVDKFCTASENRCPASQRPCFLDQIQAELDSKVEALTSKKADTDLFTEEIGKLEDKVKYTNKTLKADWERWKLNNAKCYQCLATWESFLTSRTDIHLEEASKDKLQLH
ncbi:hypothetical protein FD755_021190, partial [Muntiacus reevesi]